MDLSTARSTLGTVAYAQLSVNTACKTAAIAISYARYIAPGPAECADTDTRSQASELGAIWGIDPQF